MQSSNEVQVNEEEEKIEETRGGGGGRKEAGAEDKSGHKVFI